MTVRSSNPQDVCLLLLGGRDPPGGSNIDQVFDFRTQDLGDGTEAYVFTHKPGSDSYA